MFFGGATESYRNWQNRIRDHAADEWPHWRYILDHAAKAPHELTQEQLQKMSLFNVNAWDLSQDLWSFLLRWIGPRLYQRRTRMGKQIEGNGLELWKKNHSETAGSD